MRFYTTILFLLFSLLLQSQTAVLGIKRDGTIAPDLAGWDYARTITVNNRNTGTALDDAQIKLVLTSSNFSFEHAESDGKDIRVYDGSTELPVYVQTFTPGYAVVWFKGDVGLGASKEFFLYYGNSGASTASSYNNVFTKKINDSSLVALWNFTNGSGTSVTDNSGNGNTLTMTSPTWVSDYKFSDQNAILFNGSSTKGVASSILDVKSPAGTIEIDFKPTVNYPISTDVHLFHKINTTGAEGFDLVIEGSSGSLKFITYTTGSGGQFVEGAARSWLTTQDYTVAVSWDVYFNYLYVNGVLYAKSLRLPWPADNDDEDFILGSNGSSSFFQGYISGVLVSQYRLTEGRALAHFERRQLIPEKQIDKFNPILGKDSVLVTRTGDWNDFAIFGEVTLWGERDTIYGVHTGYDGTHESMSTFKWTSGYDPVVTSPVPVWGEGYIGNHAASRGYLIKVGNTFYNWRVSQPDASELFLSTTTDFVNWTEVGKVADIDQIGGSYILFGNPTIVPKQINGKWRLYFEALDNTDFAWKMHLFEADNLTDTWDYVQTIPSLTVEANKSVGGQNIFIVNGKFHNWGHYSGDFVTPGLGNSVLPGRVYHAVSDDGITWTKEPVIDIIDDPYYPTGETDQFSDPAIVEFKGQVFLYPTIGTNVPICCYAHIRRWVFNGTMEQLISGGLKTYMSKEQNISGGGGMGKVINMNTRKLKMAS